MTSRDEKLAALQEVSLFNFQGADIVWLMEQLELEIAKGRRLRDACELYSKKDAWNFYCGCCANGSTALEKDHGKLAREALAAYDHEETKP